MSRHFHFVKRMYAATAHIIPKNDIVIVRFRDVKLTPALSFGDVVIDDVAIGDVVNGSLVIVRFRE